MTEQQNEGQHSADRTDADVPGAEAAPDDVNRPADEADESPETVDETPDAGESEREKDGTVGDFDGDVRAFNERESDTDDEGNEIATFRSATGHNDADPEDEDK